MYHATELGSGRRVALKLFSSTWAAGAGARADFEHVAATQALVHHPAVARIHRWSAGPRPYLAMDLVEGATLADMLAGGRLDDATALRILAAVASGLDAGAGYGLVYRRLQPHGVLIPAVGEPAVLGDFGAGHTGCVDRDRIGGFIDYVSPEEVEGEESSLRSVVYSFAALACECLTGRPPPRRGDDDPLHSPRSRRPELPEAVDGVFAQRPGPGPVRPAAVPQRPHPPARAGVPRRHSGRRRHRCASRPSGGRGRRRCARRAPWSPVRSHVASPPRVGVAAGIGGSPAPRAVTPARLDGAALSLRYPANWRPALPPALTGIRLRAPRAVGPAAGPAAGRLVAGQLASGELPEPRGRTVSLRTGEAREYRGARTAGGTRPVRLYAIPARGGAVIAACVGPDAGVFADRCVRAVSTLRAARPGTPLVSASQGYARALSRTVRRIDRVRVNRRGRLARARTRAGQRKLAARTSRDYQRLAEVLARVSTPAPAAASQRTALRQLRRASRGYADMSRAARDQAPGSWLKARRGVRSAEGRFQRALRDLRRLGYRVG